MSASPPTIITPKNMIRTDLMQWRKVVYFDGLIRTDHNAVDHTDILSALRTVADHLQHRRLWHVLSSVQRS